MRVLVTGATGFVGRALVPALTGAGHEVSAMTRHPQSYSGAGTPVLGDLAAPDTVPAALADHDVAYYLVHSLDRRDFARRDAAAARAFGLAAAGAGVGHIVYLGGLGDPATGLSAHLRSRQQVEGLLGTGGVPVTTLRAGVVIGDGSTSWEIIRSLVEKVPALVVPSFATTRTQPIAIADTVRYLVGVLDGAAAGATRVFDIGGSEVLRYHELLSRLAALEGRPSLQLPFPAPLQSVGLAAEIAARVLPLLSGVDANTVRALVRSLPCEVVVRDDAIRTVVPFEPMGFDDAALEALGARARRRRKDAP